jgi:hypothetical protein
MSCRLWCVVLWLLRCQDGGLVAVLPAAAGCVWRHAWELLRSPARPQPDWHRLSPRHPNVLAARVQEVPADVLVEFDQRLGEDLQSVAVTLTAVTGVIIFWRGVWSLLDCEFGCGPAVAVGVLCRGEAVSWAAQPLPGPHSPHSPPPLHHVCRMPPPPLLLLLPHPHTDFLGDSILATCAASWAG